MIDFLSKGFQKVVNTIKGKKIITQKHIDEVMEDVFMSLLQADVNYEVALAFNKKIKSQAIGKEVLKSLNPNQQIIKILNEVLIETLYSDNITLNIDNQMNIFMLIGLQGSGKTTVAGKLAILMKKKFQKKVLLIACDIYRPGAIAQLKDIGNQIGIQVFFKDNETVKNIVDEGLRFATFNDYNVVIIDTAGTLNIDKIMMEELNIIKKISNPNEVLLVIDVLFGKEIFNVAKSFHKQIGATGVILTKMDSDTKGGSVLSVKEVTNLPIKLISSSEKMDDLEIFDAKRMASRLLGMGDVLTVIDKLTENIDQKQGKKMIDRLLHDDYNYYDFQKQLKILKKMGSVSKLLRLIPGLSSRLGNLNLNDSQLQKFDIIIKSMTKKERNKPSLLVISNRRRLRIAKGSGTTNKDVNNLMLVLEQQKKIAKQMNNLDIDNIDIQKNPNLILDHLLNADKDK